MWFKINNQNITLFIYAKPNAKRTTLLKVDDQGLHIALHAKPHEGEANKELIFYLAKLFDISKSLVILKRGVSSRRKEIVVPLTPQVQQFVDDPTSFYGKYF